MLVKCGHVFSIFQLRKDQNKPADIHRSMLSSTHMTSIDIIPYESCSMKILNFAHQKFRAQQELDRIAEKVGQENPVFTVTNDDNWLQPHQQEIPLNLDCRHPGLLFDGLTFVRLPFALSLTFVAI